MNIGIVTIFPEYFQGVLATGMIRKAREDGLADFLFVNPRDFAKDNYRSVDDYPYGGGSGMVMKYEFQTGPEIVAVVSSLTSIKQIPIAFHFYSTFEDDSTITNLIEKASKYSTAFHRAN